MLKLTGRIADGVVLSAALSVQSVRESLAMCAAAATKAGRDAGAFRRAGYLFFSVQQSRRAAVDAVKTKLAFVMRNRFLAENVRRSGIAVDHEAVIAAVAKRDLVAAAALISDEAADAFTVAGTPAECRRRLQDYIDAGLDEPVISPIGGAASLPLILPILRDFAR
jgi:5,10-methylenetetrahydromethanopterin reductase